MLAQFRGLVLSELPWGDNDKLLTVLTAEAGKVAVLLKATCLWHLTFPTG